MSPEAMEASIQRIQARTRALENAPPHLRKKLADAFRTRLGWGVDGFSSHLGPAPAGHEGEALETSLQTNQKP